MTRVVQIELRFLQNSEVITRIEIAGKKSEKRLNLSDYSRLIALVEKWRSAYLSYPKESTRRLIDSTPAEGFRIILKKITHLGSVNQSTNELRAEFNKWLSGSQLENLIHTNTTKDDDIRIIIRPENNALYNLPWAEWKFISQERPNTTIAMGYPDFELIQSDLRQPPSRQKILVILGDSTGINIERDANFFENIKHHADIKILRQPSQDELLDVLGNNPWDMLYFAGHSDTEGERGLIQLGDQTVSIDQLWFALRKAARKGLQVAIFNSCNGLGIADQLNDPCIPASIIMREAVHDEVAFQFLKSFLQDVFVNGSPFHTAFRNAQQSLKSIEHRYPCASWLPTLFQRPDFIPPWETPTPKKEKKFYQLKRTWIAVASIAYIACAPTISNVIYLRYMNMIGNDPLMLSETLIHLAILHNPFDGTYPYMAGRFYEDNKNNRARAEKYYSHGYSLGNHEAGVQLSKLLRLRFDYHQSLQIITNLLGNPELKPENKAASLMNRGHIRKDQNRLKEAELDFREVINLNNNSPEAHCGLAETLERQGKSDEARIHWHKVYEFNGHLTKENDNCKGRATKKLSN
jgi:tetratricopeptide (TPR) repeat protein